MVFGTGVEIWRPKVKVRAWGLKINKQRIDTPLRALGAFEPLGLGQILGGRGDISI